MTLWNLISGAVFLLSGSLIIYVLAGYPLLLARIARRQTRTIQKDAVLRRVSVVVAVRNGEKFLAAKLRSILACNYPRELMEITVVSDGSDDATDGIAFEQIFQSKEIL